jgi:hypothetical protein
MYRVKNEKVKDAFSSSAEPLLQAATLLNSAMPKAKKSPQIKSVTEPERVGQYSD